MHIAFVTPEYPNIHKPEGGLGNYIQKIALLLTERGHRVTIFVLGNHNVKENNKGLDLHFVKEAKFHWRLKKNAFIAGWLELAEWWVNTRQIRQAVLSLHHYQPLDIVQISSYKSLGNALLHNDNFPIICRCSSYSPLLLAANGSQRQLHDVIAGWIETRQVNNSDAAFAPSNFIAHIYKRFEAVQPFVINTPLDVLDLELDDTIYHEMIDGRKYLLYFGTLNPVKGVDVLIQAAPHVLSKYEDIDLLFIGRNDDLQGGIKALNKIKQKLGGFWEGNRILYFPPLPKAQLYPIIQHAQGVIMPSRIDNYPNACLEALSLGVPVVGSSCSSLNEIILDGSTGFLFKNGDPDDLCTAIDRLMSLTKTERNQMSSEIVSEINRITSEDRVGQLIKFFESSCVYRET